MHDFKRLTHGIRTSFFFSVKRFREYTLRKLTFFKILSTAVREIKHNYSGRSIHPVQTVRVLFANLATGNTDVSNENRRGGGRSLASFFSYFSPRGFDGKVKNSYQRSVVVVSLMLNYEIARET